MQIRRPAFRPSTAFPPQAPRWLCTAALLLVALPQAIRGGEKFCRCLGIGHGPGYHAYGCCPVCGLPTFGAGSGLFADHPKRPRPYGCYRRPFPRPDVLYGSYYTLPLAYPYAALGPFPPAATMGPGIDATHDALLPTEIEQPTPVPAESGEILVTPPSSGGDETPAPGSPSPENPAAAAENPTPDAHSDHLASGPTPPRDAEPGGDLPGPGFAGFKSSQLKISRRRVPTSGLHRAAQGPAVKPVETRLLDETALQPQN